FTVRKDKSDAIVFSYLAVYAHNAEQSIVSVQRISIDHALARLLIICHKRPDGPAADLAGKPGAIKRIDEPPRKHQIQRRLKVVLIFLEERTLLWKEPFEPLIHCDLRIV